MARKRSATVQLKIRMKEPLRAKVEKEAKKRGVSLNSEVVSRIEDTFINRDDLFGGANRYRLMRFLATGIELVELKTGKSWENDIKTKEAVKAATSALFDTFGPSFDEKAVTRQADTLVKGGKVVGGQVGTLVKGRRRVLSGDIGRQLGNEVMKGMIEALRHQASERPNKKTAA